MGDPGPSGGAIFAGAEAWLLVPLTQSNAAWYVIQSKRHRERFAQCSLAVGGIASYLPLIRQWPRPAVGSEIAPMFPGYLFVYGVLPDDFMRVSHTPGVKEFVTFGEFPPALDPSVIDYFRSCQGADGVIRCGEDDIEGREIVIVDGPFRGLTAVVEQRLPARERVRVLLNILQRLTPVELPDKWIRRA